MKKYLFVALLSCASWVSYAQEERNPEQAATMSLQECIEYAWEQNAAMRKAQYDVQKATAQVRETVGVGLPQINGQAQFIDNINVQRSFVPAEFFGGEPGTFVPVTFQPKYNSNASITATQLIFNGSYFVGLQASRAYKEFSVRQLAVKKVEVAQQVSKAYLNVLINEERLGLLQANLQRLDSLLIQTKALNEAGFAEEIDVFRVEVARNNLRAEYEKVSRLVNLSYVLLKFQMGMPLEQDLKLSQTLADFQLSVVTQEMLQAEAAVENRPEYKLTEQAIQLQELNKKNVLSGYLPTLSAFATIGANFAGQNLDGYTDFENRWFEYSLVGLRLDVPIFDGLQKKYKTQQNKIEIAKLEEDKRQLTQAIQMEVMQAQINFQNAISSLEAQKRNLELAKEVARIAAIKYQEGVGSNLEVIDAETAFKEAETNYYNALYEAWSAKIDLDKALGTLVQE
ncbi:MAG: transporter [Thermonema sp.]|uniref:TolC family protein n=1 Tax=Thermonema sp. TaxID=2231181 RepID=UPI0021DD47C4|nr:TolC family protein [Thermonema sp.]GIV39974.1 MAG: transporter [Thermonema sp.]